MTVELIAFGAGILLIVAGIFGGGLEVKEIKIPSITPVSRAASMAVGLALCGLALWLKSPELFKPSFQPGVIASTPSSQQRSEPAPTAPAIASQDKVETIQFRIIHEIGGDQLDERVTLNFDGVDVGSSRVTREKPTRDIFVTVPRRSSYKYRIWATTTIKQDEGPPLIVPSGGVFDVAVNDGDTFYFSLLRIKTTSGQEEPGQMQLKKH